MAINSAFENAIYSLDDDWVIIVIIVIIYQPLEIATVQQNHYLAF